MDIKLLTVGKLKEKYLIQGIQEYAKRLSAYTKFSIIEVPDEKAPENLSHAQMEQVKDKEGQRLLNKIKDDDYVIVLAIKGKELSSEDFAEHLEKMTVQGKSHFTFVIGGSLGLSNDVLKRANFDISFGRLTYPHQLMRLILTEQIYRAFRIIHHEPYHK